MRARRPTSSLVLLVMRPSVLIGSLLLGSIVFAGCGTSRPASHDSAPARADSGAAAVSQQLHAVAEDWRGTPHEWGGVTKRGVDCSGLVHTVFRNTFDRSLPRTTQDQSKAGVRIRRSALQPGDLVFFRVDTRGGRHVGIYLSEGNFLHASSSRGVTVSSLDRSYWSGRWWQARRVLSALDSTSSHSQSSSPTRSIGWK